MFLGTFKDCCKKPIFFTQNLVHYFETDVLAWLTKSTIYVTFFVDMISVQTRQVTIRPTDLFGIDLIIFFSKITGFFDNL